MNGDLQNVKCSGIINDELFNSLRVKIGKKVTTKINGHNVSGLFLGFWNTDYINHTSQTEQSEIAVDYPLRVIPLEDIGMNAISTDNLHFQD